MSFRSIGLRRSENSSKRELTLRPHGLYQRRSALCRVRLRGAGVSGLARPAEFPAELNAMLADGSLDLSPVSAMAWAQNADAFALLPDLCIGARDEVVSVLLASRTPAGAAGRRGGIRDGRIGQRLQSLTRSAGAPLRRAGIVRANPRRVAASARRDSRRCSSAMPRSTRSKRSTRSISTI